MRRLAVERDGMQFDHERLDVYRLAIQYVGYFFQLANRLPRANRVARDQWLRAAQSIPLNIAEGNGKQSLNDKSRFFEIARGSALECAAMHDVLFVCNGLNRELSCDGKQKLFRIVSMLTRLIQKKNVCESTEQYVLSSTVDPPVSHYGISFSPFPCSSTELISNSSSKRNGHSESFSSGCALPLRT
jgi:four helix bundle protein